MWKDNSCTLKSDALILSIFPPFKGIPPESRMEAMQAAILLMPDPNREALQTLLLFLNEVAANSETNQVRFMTRIDV